MAERPTTTFLDEEGAEPPRTVRALEGLPLLGERYRVLGMLGGGGMGNVYLAHDIELDENVAVKLLKASLSKRREQVDLLRREVKFARRVTHPNVLRTFDIGDHEGAKFLTMELVDGRTLSDLLPRQLPLAEVARIAHAVCAGLGAAHDAGVMHRDLKPSNVLLGNDGRILLSDFGIARLADDPADGTLAGTPGFMAPELLANEPVDARADIWALGAVLFEMIAGERAFRYRDRDDLIRPLLEAAPDPRERRPDMPLALARVVTQCMARQPAARFAHPREISAAIAAALPFAPAGASGSSARMPVAGDRRTRVLAVLPLTNLGSPDDAYLAEGLTAVLIDAIDSRDLRVPSRGAVDAASPEGRDALQVGRDLGAEAVVVGSVLRNASAGVTIELRVIGTGDGLLLFSEKIECRLTEVFRAAEQASRSIARALLVDRREAEAGTNDSEAIELYLQGVHEYRRRWDQSVEKSSALFSRALERAPNDPVILSAYALALARGMSFRGDESLIPLAQTISRKALALAPDRAEPHLAVAALHLQLGENVAAARALRVAAAIAPHHPDAHNMLGILRMEVTGVAEGLAHFQTALMLDPMLVHAKWWIARGHALLGEWARCDALFTQTPADPETLNDYWVNRARTVMYGKTPERLAAFLAEFEEAPPFETKEAIAVAVRVATGEKVAIDALTLYSGDHPSKRRAAYVRTVVAETLCGAGRYDNAMDCLAKADRDGCVDIVWFDTCPVAAPLRDRDDFRALRSSVAARAATVARALAGEP